MDRRIRHTRKLHARTHRYHRIRRATQALTFVTLVAVPALGIARVDLWGGEHVVWFEPATAFTAVATAIVAILGFYFVTFVINALAGRLFCGWGCPVGEQNRLADDGNRLASVAYAGALWAVTLHWWVSPKIWVEGTLGAIAVAAGVWLALTAATVAVSHSMRWSFCRKLCPIGLYYSFVQPRGRKGTQLDAAGVCVDCNLCEVVCPVSLDPRHLDAEVHDIGGLALDGMPASSHCLQCGLCVEACEWVTRTREGSPALVFSLRALGAREGLAQGAEGEAGIGGVADGADHRGGIGAAGGDLSNVVRLDAADGDQRDRVVERSADLQ